MNIYSEKDYLNINEPGVKRMFVLVCVLCAVPPVISRPPLSTRVTEGDTTSFKCVLVLFAEYYQN